MLNFTEIRRKAYQLSCSVAPFLIGPIVVPPNRFGIDVKLYLERLLIFSLLFILWKLVRLTVNKIQRKKSKILYLPFVLSAILLMVLLQVFKPRVEVEVLYLTLCALFLLGLRERWENRTQLTQAIIANLTAISVITLLSFLLIVPFKDYAVLFLSLSIGSLFTARYIAGLLLDNRIKFTRIKEPAANWEDNDSLRDKLRLSLKLFRTSSWAELFSALLLLSPVIFAGLSVFRQLPLEYSLLLCTIPFFSTLVSKAQFTESKKLKTDAFFDETSGVCLLFIVIIALLGLYIG